MLFHVILNININLAKKSVSVWRDVSDVDFYSGGLTETVLANAVVGPTFACVINEQFKDLKNGDRFYYENGPSTTSFTLGYITRRFYSN